MTSRGQLGAALDLVVDQAAELQLAHPGYYRLTEELAPEREDSPAHQVRERLIALFVDALREAGVAEPVTDLRRVVELCIETVRHTLVRCPAEPGGTGRGRPGAEADAGVVPLGAGGLTGRSAEARNLRDQ